MSIVIYKNTDVDIAITVAGIDVADITEMTVTLEGNGQTLSFSESNGDITIDGTTINLRIEDNQIASVGPYMLRITATENGNIRGLTTDPSLINVL
ncbi:hypothetical protein [Nitrosomonas sp.]|uniref:hypothetical protein n=1 Tax=Nitrosomonas sp. TaxID=42353 RepID=UPI0025E6AFDB|nr:hypothetical protein [Nitrosomonas sp.]